MMTNAEILHCLTTARDNTVKTLVEVFPGTDEYSRMLYGIDHLNCLIERMGGNIACDYGFPNVPGTFEPAGHPDPVGEPGEPGVPDEGDTETTAPNVERERIVPEDLRAELADAKKKGVVISELIESLGAKNFSALKDDQDKLWALKEKLDKALKELGV